MENQQKVKTTAVKGTEAARRVRGFVKNIYRSAQEAKETGKMIAYVMVSSHYDEILRAMDIVPLPTRITPALAKRDMDRFLGKAEAEGYSQVLCSYARIGLGFDSMRKELGAMPEGAPRRRNAEARYDAGEQQHLRSALQVVPGSRSLSGYSSLQHRCREAIRVH